MSPSELEFQISLRYADGPTTEVAPTVLHSPGDAFVEFDISEHLGANGHTEPNSLLVRARPVPGKMPTRVNHQLVYLHGGRETGRECSINVSLSNSAVYSPAGKTGATWGQLVVGPNYDSMIGLVWHDTGGQADDVQIEFYGQNGLIDSVDHRIDPNAAVVLRSSDFPQLLTNEDRFVWFWAKSKRADLGAYSVQRHKESNHVSGDHAF